MPSLDVNTPLADWLNWLETLHPEEIELGLDRISRVYFASGAKRPARYVITVAGTNGKGSTIALLETILLNAGYAVGSYTSPHLHAYNERVRIGGIDMDDRSLCRAFERVNQVRGDISLTYFEFGTLAALELFSRHTLDVVLLEVGLGGRLDAVNIVDPDIAVVMSVALDHENWLGNDREQIGTEKAGIMRQGKPVVCGDPDPPKSLGTTAKQLGATLYCAGQQFGYEIDGDHWDWWGDFGYGRMTMYGLPVPALAGLFQFDNAAAVIAVLHLLIELPVDPYDIFEGLEHVRLPGRFQLVAAEVPCIYDVAHNPHAATALASSLREHRVSGRTRAVFGVMGDKDIAAIVKALAPEVDDWYLAALDIPRAADTDKMALACRETGISEDHLQQHGSVGEALVAARAAAKEGDRLLICGSFYTVAEGLQQHV